MQTYRMFWTPVLFDALVIELVQMDCKTGLVKKFNRSIVVVRYLLCQSRRITLVES